MKSVLKSVLKSKNGVTLVELMLVLALIGIVITVTFSLLFFGLNSFGVSSRQYDLQSELRFAMDTIVKETRFATSLEIISGNEASDSSQQEDHYSYFYLDGENLYHVKYDEGTGSHGNRVYGGHLESDSSFFKKMDATTLRIELDSKFDNRNQTYNSNTDINLMNLKQSGNSILGSEDLGLKYSISQIAN